MGTAYGKHHSAFLNGILPSGIFLVSADPFNIVSPIRVIRLVVRYIQLPHNGLEPQDRIQRLKCLERMQLQLQLVAVRTREFGIGRAAFALLQLQKMFRSKDVAFVSPSSPVLSTRIVLCPESQFRELGKRRIKLRHAGPQKFFYIIPALDQH